MSSQLQDREEATEIRGKSRFFNPFTGKDPFEEDIKKGLTIEEMRKKLEQRSAQEKIRYLESLLSRKGSSLKKGTVRGMEEIISESYRFFGDEMMDKGNYEKAAKSYKSAGDDDLAKKAWKMAGDAQMAAAQSQSSAEGFSGENQEFLPLESKRDESKKESKKGRKPGERKEERIKERIETEEQKQGKEEKKSGKKEPMQKGKKAKSGFALAAESYEYAGETEMASAAWKMAGDEYLSLSEKGDRRYLDDSLECYKKGKQFKQAVHVSLLAGKPTKGIEELAKKGNLGKQDLVSMANNFLERKLFHASRFLFSLAGEKNLADKVSNMENENKKK